MNKEKEIQTFYDDFSNNYDNFYGKITTQHYLNKEKNILKNFLNNYQQIIEIGAGTGENLCNLKTVSNKLIGIDISFKMCKKMKEKNIIAIQSNAINLPLKKIDNLLMFLFIHYFNYIDKNNFEKLLNNISTNLSNSKRIIIKESNRLNIISRLIHFIIKEKNMVNITPFYLLNTLKNNGYVIEKIYFYGFMMP
ncbi:MAG TPA: class I SAM-dependent methyltransferase, partial [bacterium]|nr:class I SAM-dependent methyltransferase [bacterium]